MTSRATESLWLDEAPSTAYPPLAGDLEVDVAVIGGGIAGVTTALLCKREGLRVAVLEKGVVSGAATGMSTAKCSALQESLLAEVRRISGTEALRAYALANQAAIERMDALVRELSIDCAWERLPDYTYAGDESQVSTVEQIVEAGQQAGLPVERVTDVPLPFDVPAAARLDGQAQFQPATYTRGLAAAVDGDGSSSSSRRWSPASPRARRTRSTSTAARPSAPGTSSSPRSTRCSTAACSSRGSRRRARTSSRASRPSSRRRRRSSPPGSRRGPSAGTATGC
jgi:hypothetical protein